MSDSTRAARPLQVGSVAEAARAHVALVPASLAGSLLIALILAVALRDSAPMPMMDEWFAVLAVALLLRGAVGVAQWRTGEDLGRPDVWLWSHRIAYLVHGLAWAAASAWLYPAEGAALQAFFVLAVAMLVGGALNMVAFDLVAGLLFGVPVLGALALRLGMGGEPTAHSMVAVLGGSIVLIVANTWRAHRNWRVDHRARERERGRAELARRDEEFLERTGALANVGGWEIELPGRTLRWTAQTCRLHDRPEGYRPHIDDAVEPYAPHAQPAIRRALQQAIDDGTPYDLELPMITATGRSIWVRTMCRPQWHDGKVSRLSGAIQDITASHETRQALAEQHHLMSLLMRTTQQGMWFIDESLCTTDVNPAMCMLLGRTREDILGRPVFDFVDEPNAQIVRREAAAHALGQPGTYELALRRPDGSLVHCQNSTTPIFDTQGRPVGRIGMFTDLTPRLRAMEAQRRYAQALNSISDPVCVIDEAGTLVLVNDAWCGDAGLVREQVVGRRAPELHPALPDELHRRAMQACLESQQPRTVRRSLQAGARRRHLETTYHPYGADAGGLRCVVAVTREITAQEEARAALAGSVDNLRALLDAFPGYIGVIDESNTYTFINERMARLLGKPASQIVGRRLRDLFDGERLQHNLRNIELAREGGSVQFERHYGSGPLHPEVDLRLHIVAGPRGPDGARSTYAFGIDVSDAARAEAALRAAKEEAERANLAKSQFLSSMSHELRTPLNAIIGFGQLLESDAEHRLAPREAGHVHEILKAGRYLLELINELLDLARIEAGRLPINLEPVDLQELVTNGLKLIDPVARERGTPVELQDLASFQRWVRADRTRLLQVLLNLVTNAIKYTHPGDRITLACVDDGEAVRLEVIDHGPGLSEEQQQRLFRPFERLDADRTAVEGTGIGLALSQRLMQAMRGGIGVRATEGGGSTFWVRLPRVAAASPAPPKEAPSTFHGALTVPNEQTVLYIEDNPVNALLMEAMLARLPQLRLVIAPVPELGIEIARVEQPGLILLDIQLPGMDGYEVLRRLQALPATRDIPVVAVSANAMPADLARGRAAGFADYLTKPVDMTQLLTVVTRTLARRRRELA